MRLTKRAKRRLVFVLVLVVAGTAAVFTISAVQQAQRERMRQAERELGLAAFERGDMETALNHLKIAVQYGQDDIEVILAFAEARGSIPMPNRAHLHEARVYYEGALELVEADETYENRETVIRDIMTNLLHVRGLLGERFEMERIADRLLDRDPTNIDALTAKVTACMRDRRFDEAMPLAEQLASLEPGSLRWLHLQLQIMRSSHDPDAALLARCDAWIASYEGDGRMHLLKSAWLYELGQVEPAQREIEVAVEDGASSLEVLEQTLNLLGLMDRHDLIAKVIDTTRERYADAPWARHAITQYAWRSGQIADAMAELERAKDELPLWPLNLERDRVLVLLAANRLSESREALQSYRQAVEIAEKDQVGLRANTVYQAIDRDRALVAALDVRLGLQPLPWPEMIRRMDEAAAIAPDEPVVQFLRGEMFAGAGEHALASTSFATAARLDPTWVAASVAHAESLLALGRTEESFEVARAAARRSPRNNLSPLLAMAQAAVQLNQLPRAEHEAVPQFESEERFAIESARRAAAGMDLAGMMLAIHEQLPTHPKTFSLLIESLVQASRDDEAKSQMQQWLAQSPLTVEQLVTATELVRRLDLGVHELLERRLREFRGNDARIPMALAWLRVDHGDTTGGLGIVERFFASAPAEVQNDAATQLARATFYLSIEHNDAESILRDLVDRFPASVPVQSFALGQTEVWDTQPLVEKIIGNLTNALGDRSQQVRLARASYLLRYFGESQEERARAVVTVQEVLQESPTSLVALTLLADAYLKSPNGMPMYEQAVDALQTAVDVHQREVTLYPKLISLLQRLGRYDEARRYLVLLSRVGTTTPEMARAEVELLLTQGDFEKALLRATSFITEHSPPSDVLLLAVMHDRNGNTNEAAALFEQLLADPEAATIVRTQAAEFFARHGEFERGYALLKQELEERHTPGEREVFLGWYCYRYGEEDRADTHFSNAVTFAPNSPDAWHALARFHLSRRQFADAERIASEGLDATDGDERLRADLALAVAGASGQSWRESLSRLGLQASDVPGLLATLELAAQVSNGQGETSAKPTEAQLEAARTLIEEQPRFLPAWYLAIALHANADRMTAATELARSAMSRFPTRPEPAEWSVRLFMQSGRWNEALSSAEEWAARASTDQVAPQCAIANAMLKLDRAASAVIRLRPYANEIIARRNVHPEQAMVLIDTFLGAGEIDELLEFASVMLSEPAWRARWAFAARSASPAVASTVLESLRAYAAPGETGLFEEQLGLAAEWQMLAARTDDPRWLERAELLAREVKANAASEALKTAAEFILATVDETRGDMASAAQRYRNVISAKPDHALAMNNLAYLLYQQDADDAEALALARKAAELMPDSPDVLDTLGVVLLASGKAAEAESNLRKALSARPDDVNISLNLVDAIIHQQRFDEAARTLETLQRTLRRMPMRGVEFDDRVQELQQQIRDRVTVAQPSSS